MNREQWKERLPLIQAFVEGKEIESLCLNGVWDNLNKNVEFTDPVNRYRIKQEPKLRPWKPEEVPVGAAFRYGGDGLPTAWVDTAPTGLMLGLFPSSKATSYEELAERWQYSTDHGKTWLPCGVLE